MNDIFRFLKLPLKDDDSSFNDHLKNNGYGLINATLETSWLLDSITFLKKNRAVVGMVATTNEGARVAYKLDKITEKLLPSGDTIKFEARAAVDDALQQQNVDIIWRMWIPIQRALATHEVIPNAIHITHTSLAPHERIECEMTSGFRPQLVSYEDQQECIKAQFRRFNKPCLMSNGDGVTLCRPQRKGWRAQRLLSIECLNKYRSAERIVEVLYNKIRIEAERNPDNKVELLSVSAHALHAAARACGLTISGDDFSIFDAEEEALLKEYDKRITENMKKVADVNSDDECAIPQRATHRNSMNESIRDKRKRLQKEREERERRKQQAELFEGLFSVN